jgi:hypothetical protein
LAGTCQDYQNGTEFPPNNFIEYRFSTIEGKLNMPLPQIATIGFVDDDKNKWMQEGTYSFKIAGVGRTQPGEYVFKFEPPVYNARVFVTTTGYAARRVPTDCYALVRQINEHGFIVNTFSPGGALANTSFWFMIVQTDGTGFLIDITTGPP